MPRKPDLPCADCGELMWSGATSLPEGQARCRPCRRATPPPPKAAPMQCVDCGTAAHGVRCRPCFIAYCKANALPRYRSGRKRYYMDRAAPGLNSWEQRRVLLRTWQQQQRDCAYCSGPAETVDHVIPLIRGGTNYEGNLVPCCLACNVKKSDRLLIEWRLSKRATATRVVVVVPPKAQPKVKPVRWVEQAFRICLQCGALHDGKARCCGSECEREWNRVEMRNKYRERVGIPVGAPLWSRAGDAA